MEESIEETYNKFVLGVAGVVDTLHKEPMFDAKCAGHHTLRVWANCFINTLVAANMQIEEFIEAFLEFKKGNKTVILELNFLPINLKCNKRLAVKYIEALVYVTLKRDLNRTLPIYK